MQIEQKENNKISSNSRFLATFFGERVASSSNLGQTKLRCKRLESF